MCLSDVVLMHNKCDYRGSQNCSDEVNIEQDNAQQCVYHCNENLRIKIFYPLKDRQIFIVNFWNTIFFYVCCQPVAKKNVLKL